MDLQEFYKIPNVENYLISKDGRIYSLKTKKILSNVNDKDGYKIIKLNKKMNKIHRLLAITFIPNPFGKPQVNHINGIKNDNRLCNLEWCTPSENVIHRYKYLYKGDTEETRYKKSACNIKSRKVKNIQTGEVYPSASYAARKNGFKRKAIYEAIVGICNKTGFDWEYLNV